MITINLMKAKIIAHTLRRDARDKEFKPYDDVIMKQIPGNDFAEAESARQLIREKYAQIQISMDNAATVDELKSIVDGMIQN